jgi:hypothetical protein
MPQIINVSAYDPKEKQRSGVSYSEHNVSALRANGASGLIARAGKGGKLDEKCATFLASADRVGMLPGVYYRLQRHVDAGAQADQFIARAKALARSRSWNTPSLLLCADFDAQSRLSDIVRFMDRVESRTGVVPVAYLENSTHLKLLLRNADARTKAKLRRMPYWVALYSPTSGAGPQFPAPGSPDGLVKQYDVWSDWALWQYAGRRLGARTVASKGLQPRDVSLPAVLREHRSPAGTQCLQRLARSAAELLGQARVEAELTARVTGGRICPPMDRLQTMKQSFVQCAEVILEAGADPAAPGGAVTLALCGSWDHPGACRWPHHTSAVWDGRDDRRGEVRVVFVADREEEGHVRALIDRALASGECRGPHGQRSQWAVTDHRAGVLSETEKVWGCSDGRAAFGMTVLDLPADYPRIKVVRSFAELVETPFDDQINALCWPRTLPGDFGEVVALLGGGEGIITLDDARLRSLPVSAAGRAAIEILLEDQQLLREHDRDPVLNCIYDYPRDEEPGPVRTDVFSFHADSAPVEADTWLCTYHGPASEGLRNDEAQRRIDIAETRAELLALFGGEDDDDFREWLSEHCFDLHYAAVPRARPFSFGLGNLWRIAVEWPGSPVPPCIHRAPETLSGDGPRLLMIS